MDNKKLKGPIDDSLINLNQPYEIQYWSDTFSVVPALLREAVEKSGSNSPEKVRQWLIEEEFIDA